MNELNQYIVALDYVAGFDDDVVTVGELALIYAILPEVLLDMMANDNMNEK